MSKEEARLKKKLAKKDSSAAARIFDEAEAEYANLENKIKNQTGKIDQFRNKYIPHLDTLQTAFHFLQKTDGLLSHTPEAQLQFKNALGSLGELQGKFTQAEEIKKYLKQRREFLQQQLEQYDLLKEFKKFKKEVYYYQAQVDEYKNMFDDPSKLEAKAIELLKQTSLFRNFFANNSQLAGLFRLPGSASSSATSTPVSLAGLQTRDAIQQEMLQGAFKIVAIKNV